MIFNSLAYFAIFLVPTALLFRKVPVALRSWVCAVAGIAFFIFYSITTVGGIPGAACLLILLYQSLCCVYLCKPGGRGSQWTIIQAILFLCVFKYLNFFGSLFYGKADHSPLYWKDAFLPLGISFFTFEFIHFAVDRYKGKISAVKLGDFLAFALFFPTMVAGPIKRFQDFEPKLLHPSKDWPADLNRGTTRILYGLAKKFALADVLTALTNHLNSRDIGAMHSRAILLVWMFAYGFKIYFDFSAYSDIAIGSARIFGIRVPENFDSPLLQRNIAEFWQHWHISLYRWLVDYIFIPLGGSRVPTWMVYRNLIIVMLASGLWHGAGINFLVWGAWHAMLLCIHRLWLKARPTQPVSAETPSVWYVSFASWALTFLAVNFGWVFFAMDFPTACVFFQRLFRA